MTDISQKQGGWTPGPWTKVRGELVGSNGRRVVEYGSGCAFMCGGPDPESVANAAIRNAAPELYDALAEFSREYDGFLDGDGNACPTLLKARAALSRANPSTDQGEG